MNNSAGVLTAPTKMDDFLERAFAKRAVLHSNSWGFPYPPYGPYIQTGYDRYAEGIDTYMYTHPKSLVLFAAGNDLRLAPSMETHAVLGGPASAKNSIAVGAC
jgi:hypothetical protein